MPVRDPDSITSQQYQGCASTRLKKEWPVGMTNEILIESTYPELAIAVASLIRLQNYENSTFCSISSDAHHNTSKRKIISICHVTNISSQLLLS